MTKKNNGPIKDMSPEQQVELAAKYEKGIGVKESTAMALHLYQLAADKGNAQAQQWLGFQYINNYIIARNLEKGVSLLRLSAAQGNAAAHSLLGRLHFKGLGVEKDIKEAFRLYHIAAEKGDVHAQYFLASHYDNGVNVEKDDKKAARFYRLAADQNLLAAQYRLGVMSQEGIGVEKDAKEAVRLYRLADQLVRAQYQLAVCYHDGVGVEKNIKEALRLYHLIIDNSHSKHVVIDPDAKEDMQAFTMRGKAECIVGNHYLTGYLCIRDPIKAVRLFQLAVQKGVMPTQKMLTSCYQSFGLMKMKNKRDVNEVRYWQTEVEKFSGKQIEFVI